MTQVSNFIIPAIVFLVVAFGVLNHVKIYECFLKGAADGLKIVWEIVPTLIGLMMGVGVLCAFGEGAVAGGRAFRLSCADPYAARSEALFLLGGHGTGAGRLWHLWSGFLSRPDHQYCHELHGDGFLYPERVLPRREGNKNPLRADGSTPVNGSGDDCRDISSRGHDVNLRMRKA